MADDHKAYFPRVNGGKFTLEEYNKGGKHIYGTRTVDASVMDNYIHVEQ